MGLSYDLISEFVKITNDKKEGAKEGTVYATVVNSTGGKYVKIDGSDLLTPIDTTTGIDDGERVTVMIKDHKATVTGNITSPSVGTNKFDSLVGTIVDANLEGINADIENLIAKNAYLENVFAQNSILIDSKIENLVAKDSYLENTYAENATIIDSKIENLEATDSRIENSVIENFQVIDGVVQDLKATNADIKILNADFAQIKTLVNGNLTSDNILSFNLTSEKVTVDDAFIKDAMIDTISAGKINAGKINTNSVSIGSEDGGMLITGSTQQFMDKNGNVRIQIGKDASGDFTFILYGEDGTGQLINQNGITASAIGDGLIVNDMVSDNAAISGGKLDISSVITEINSDNSTTIKSSKIYLNDQAQSLEVAFNSLKTKVDTIQEVTIQGDLTAIVEQVQSNTSKIEANRDNISTLISENSVVKKQVTDLQGTVSKTESTLTSKYTSLNQNLEGFKTTVADTYATNSSVTDVVDNIEANYSTTSAMNSAIEQKAQAISASVSSTYATKNQVSTLDNTLKKDYSTTKQMESAINVAKEEINLGVSTTYETKENVQTKVTSTLNSAKSYADTKKTEAINTAASDATTKANNAKSEAIKSANNTLTSTISNYYTKSQTDSQINVAKEEINLGVSTTYETKENVQTKVTSTLNSAKSYADTKKKEAISTAATDATSKANTAKQEAISSANNTLKSTIADYYTKAQTDSQINVAKEAINLGVSTTYETKANVTSKINNIQVGGTNLWVLLDLKTGYENNGNIIGSGIQHKIRNTIIPTNGAKQLVYQCWNPNKVTNSSNTNRVAFFNSSKAYISSTKVLALNGQTYQWQIIDIPTNAVYMRLGAICGSADKYDTTIKIKFELGNKPTDYSLAPEDVTNDISTAKTEAITSANNTLTSTISNYYTKAQTDSQINIAKEAINLGVSTTYETKKNVQTKVTSTLNSAKSYADTKKTEAINTAASDATTKANNAKSEAIKSAASDATTKANNAKSEAIKSANNTLTSTISNYYTKSQTDSQINIAKEAINLGVSTTYETKANVESKIKDISVGGTNLAFDTNKGVTSWDWAIQTNGGKTITEYLADGVKGVKMTKDAKNASGWNYVSYGRFKRDKITPATTYVVSFEMKSNKTFNVGSVNLMNADGTNTLLKSSTAVQNKVTADSTAWSKIIFRLVTRDTLSTSTSQVIYITGIPCTANATHYLRNLKLEAGNTPTAWSPAPEDVTNDISTAKTEAIKSANNTLTSTISNYYTKAQTDSQINVAKNAITSSVSSTYETKTDSTTKYNTTTKQVSSLTTRMSTAESKITDTAITSTVKRNFYTKTETDGKVTTVQNNMNSSVTQLSNQIATKVDVNGVKSTIQQNPDSVKIGFNKISNALTIDSTGMLAKAQNGNKYFQLGYNGITMYNPENGTHEWGRLSAINSKFTLASNGNSSGLSIGHFVDNVYAEDMLCDSSGKITIARELNHNGILYNNYGQVFIKQTGQGGWEITGRSDSQAIKPGGANQGAIGSSTQYVNQSWIANRYNPSSIEVKHVSHYVDDNQCISLVNGVQPARYFYKEYDEEGNDITTFASRSSQLGLIYEDVRECSARDLITNEEDKGINLYGMISVLWGATRNVNTRLNDAEYEIVLLKEELEQLKNKLGEK